MNRPPPPLPPQRPTNLQQTSRLTGKSGAGVEEPYREQQLDPAVIVLALVLFLVLFLLLTTVAYKLVTSAGGSEATAQVEGAGDALDAGSVGTSFENLEENETGLGGAQPDAESRPETQESNHGGGVEDASESSELEQTGEDAVDEPELPDEGSSSAP